MYQFIVLGLGFLLLFGGGYLIKKSDSVGVLSSSLAATSSPSSITFDGVFSCEDAKCPDPRSLTVSDDGSVSITTTYNGGVETRRESGTWSEDKNGNITINVMGDDMGNYDKPSIIALRQVTPFTLISANGTTYKDWGSPTFRKQNRDTE